MLRGSIFVGLLCVFTRLTAAVSIEMMCHEHPYGTLLPNPRDCSSYYVCQSGPELAHCDHGLHFDRTYKVCNWPHWANCKIEVEFLKHPTQSDTGAKQAENSKENETLHDNNPLDESSPRKDIHKPIHVYLPNYEAFDSNGVASHKISNLEQNGSPLELESTKQSTSLAFEVPVDAPVEDFDEEVAESKNVTNEIPVAKPADDLKVEVQVPVAPEIEILYSKPVSAEILDNIEAQVDSTQVFVAVPNDSNKISLQSQVVQIPVVVATDVSNSVPEKSVADNKGKKQSNQIYESLLSKEKDFLSKMENLNDLNSESESAEIVEKIDSIVVKLPVKDLTSEIMEEKVVDTQKPVKASPKEVSDSAHNDQVEGSESDIIEEKPELLKPLDNKVIELLVEVSPQGALNAANNIQVADLKPEITGEKIESQKPLDNQMITLPVKASPEDASNAANGVLVVDSKPEIVGEKVGSEKPLDYQVIEIPVEALPDEISNTVKIVPFEGSKPEIIGQKVVDSQKPSENQVIELPVEAFATEAVDLLPEVDVTSNVTVEKVESQKTSENSIQVIELLVPYVPNDISNVATENRTPQIEAEKIASSIGSGNANTPSQILHLPVPSDVGINPMNSGKINQNLNSNSEHESEELNSDSSEGIQLLASSSSSEENIANKSTHLSEEDESFSNSNELPNPTFPIDSLNKPEKENPDMSQSSESIQESEESSEEVIDNSNTQNNLHQPFTSSSEEGTLVESPEKEVSLHNPINFESSEEEDEDEMDKFQESKTPRPNKYITSSVVLEPNGPSKPADKLPNSQRKNISQNTTFNLIVSMLSVVSAKNGSTIYRPIVGAHSTETGHPIETMTGYNTKNVQCIHNGLYFLPHPSSCQKYFICAYQNLHLHSCGDDLVWNFKREQCELKSNSRCYSREAHDVADKPSPMNTSRPSKESSIDEITLVSEKTTITTRMPPLRTMQTSAVTAKDDGKGPICPGLRQMYLPSLDNCNKYYICILGEPVLTSCPDNLHWDAKGEFCGHQEVVHCAAR